MPETSWHLFYGGELQGLYGLLIAPLAFLAYRAVAPPDQARAVVPEATRFVSILTLVFAVETAIDPIATGPLVRSEWLAGTLAAQVIPFFFVLLGDLRVLLLAIGVARPERALTRNLGWASGTALLVPITTGLLYGGARLVWPDLPELVLWMIYELGFFLLCLFLGRVWVARSLASEPARASYLRDLLGYSAAYYALWLSADCLIVLGELDLGWAIRIVPNQLYYGLWAPFVYARFFWSRPESATRSPNASR
ncbi:MAG TPA: hypothetical protein VKA74_00100 [Myxococcota bacterium]|nr:hypothetical protein [Myxococcota bacterium]